MAPPPPCTAGPTSATVSGVAAASWRCIERVTCTFPWASGLLAVCDPLILTLNGAAGTPPGPPVVAGVVVVGAVATPAAAALRRASWARRAVEVPERWDHPGRRG